MSNINRARMCPKPSKQKTIPVIVNGIKYSKAVMISNHIILVRCKKSYFDIRTFSLFIGNLYLINNQVKHNIE